MTVNAAIKIIRKDAAFLGMTFDGIVRDVKLNPAAFPLSVIKAVRVYSESPVPNLRQQDLCND